MTLERPALLHAPSPQERTALESMQAHVAELQQRVAAAEGELATLERQVAQAKQGAAPELVACLAIVVLDAQGAA